MMLIVCLLLLGLALSTRCSSGPSFEESILNSALLKIYGSNIPPPHATTDLPSLHSGLINDTSYIDSTRSTMLRVCNALRKPSDRQRLGCCRPKSLIHLFNVLFDGKKLVVFTGGDANSSNNATSTAVGQSFEHVKMLPPIPSFLMHKQYKWNLPMIHRAERFDPKLHCSSYFKGTLHVFGEFTVQNVFHSLNDNVLPLLSQVVQDVYLHPAFALAPRARLSGVTGASAAAAAASTEKQMPHLEIIEKAIPTVFQAGRLRGACFQRVIWGDGLRLVYNHMLGRLRRETADLLREIVIQGYKPPNPFIYSAATQLEEEKQQQQQQQQVEDFLIQVKKKIPPIKTSAVKKQKKLPAKRSRQSLSGASQNRSRSNDDYSEDGVVHFTKNALSSLVNVDSPMLAAAVSEALREIEQERQRATTASDQIAVVAAMKERGVKLSQLRALRRQLRHFTSSGGRAPVQIQIEHSNRGSTVIPGKGVSTSNSQLQARLDSSLRRDRVTAAATQLAATNSSSSSRKSSSEQGRQQQQMQESALSVYRRKVSWSAQRCSSCAFYPIGTCHTNAVAAVVAGTDHNEGAAADSDADCFVTETAISTAAAADSSSQPLLSADRRPMNVAIFSRGTTGKGRTLAREDLLRDRLREQLGARVVICCDFRRVSFAAQLGHAVHADVIIGVHGAGLANLLFAPRGVIVVELKLRYGFGLDLFSVCTEGRLGTLVHLNIKKYDVNPINKPIDMELVNRIIRGTSLAIQQREEFVQKQNQLQSDDRATVATPAAIAAAAYGRAYSPHVVHPVQQLPGGLDGDLLVFTPANALAYAIYPPAHLQLRASKYSVSKFNRNSTISGTVATSDAFNGNDVGAAGVRNSAQMRVDSQAHILGPPGSASAVRAACSLLPLQKFWSVMETNTDQFCNPCGNVGAA